MQIFFWEKALQRLYFILCYKFRLNKISMSRNINIIFYKGKEKKGIFETLSVQLSDDIKLKSQIIKSQNCTPKHVKILFKKWIQ
jgi:hypothetical protein